MRTGNICIHFIDEDKESLFSREYVSHVPSVGDEIRVGGDGNEQYFTVTRIVWVYDEPDHSYERVNIGIKKILDKSE